MRILLVVLRTLSTQLQPALEEDGYIVEWTDLIEKADFKATSNNFDVVVVEGELLRNRLLPCLLRWRREGLQAHLIVLLPMQTTPEDRTSVLDAGADAYMLRPFTIDEVRARLRALCRTLETPSPILHIHDLEINTKLRTVKRAGVPIHLTPREFDLLQFLAYHQGRVVSRAMIRQHLYDDEDENNSNVVDVYIRYLRSKIDKGFPTPLILTRWGEGYLIRPNAG